MNWYRWDKGVLTLNLHIQPKASKDEWVGLHGDRMKVRIKAPPVDGRANQYLLAFIAKEFSVTKSACKLVSGETGREKRIAVTQPKTFPALPQNLTFDIHINLYH